MKNIIKNIIVSFIVMFILSSAGFVQADNGLTLNIDNDCDIQYAGNNCVLELELQNNTGKVLGGKLFFVMSHEDGLFDGEGVEVLLEGESSDWIDGSVMFSDFNIEQGDSLLNLLIQTDSALVSGKYGFVLTITGEKEEQSAGGAVILYSMVGGGSHSTTTPFVKVEKKLLGESLPEELVSRIKETEKVIIGGPSLGSSTIVETKQIIKNIIINNEQYLNWLSFYLAIWIFFFIIILFILFLIVLLIFYYQFYKNKK